MDSEPTTDLTMENTEAQVAQAFATFNIDDSAVEDATPDAPQLEDTAYQPTQEELEAAALFDEHNADTEPEQANQARPMTEQEIADYEFALLLQAQEDNPHNVNIPHQDQDMPPAPPETAECACGEVFAEQTFDAVIWLRCGHVRCVPCFNENIRVGLESKKNFPPRCCPGLPIEIADYEDLLEEDVLQRYRAVEKEYRDVAPVYCAGRGCGRYLARETFSEELRWASCTECTAAAAESLIKGGETGAAVGASEATSSSSVMVSPLSSADSSATSLVLDVVGAHLNAASSPTSTRTPPTIRTCTSCLALESLHTSPTQCPERIDKMDKDLMLKEGYKPCPACKSMIEKDEGCDHMQCECGQDFCYACGRRYDGGLPCNCHGRNAWVDEVDEDENDPDVQRGDFGGHTEGRFG